MSRLDLVDENLLKQEESQLYDAGAERGILRCIMAKPGLITEAEQKLHPNMFMHEQNRYCYQVMLFVFHSCIRNGWPISFDEVSVLSVAQQMGEVYVKAFAQKTEGMAWWREIKNASAYTEMESFPRYVDTVRDRAARVQLFRESRRLQKAVRDFDVHPEASKLAGQYEASFSRVAYGVGGGEESQMHRLGYYADPFTEKVRMSAQNPDSGVFHLHHPEFPFWMQKMGGGFRRNSLTIVAARPKVGKTTLLLYLAMKFALMQIPILFLDTEMSGEEMFSRELSNISGIHEHALLAGKFYTDSTPESRVDLQSVQDAIAAIRNAPFYYVSIAGKQPEYALSQMRQFRNDVVKPQEIMVNNKIETITGKCAVFYDWLKLPTGSSPDIKEYQLLGNLCTNLKDTAKRLGLPVIAGAQQNRANIGMKDEIEKIENAEATVAGSDRLNQFCSTLCILNNTSIAMSEAIEMQYGKQRPGEDMEGLRFNQFLQIVMQRQGGEYRYGIPLHLSRGRARYEEVSDEPTLKFLKDYILNRKAARSRSVVPMPPKSAVNHASA